MYEGTRHREAYMRRGGWGERTGRGSVAPRSHAFRSVMAAAGRSDALRPSSSCAHAYAAAAGPGRPAGLVALTERGEKERPRKTERKRRALSSVRARCLLDIRGHESPRNTGTPRSFAQRASFPARVSTRTLDVSESTYIASDASLSVLVSAPFFSYRCFTRSRILRLIH